MNLNDITFFKTAQGSKYIRLPDGRLRRWKSSHANTGGEDMGLHSWSTQSIFVDPKYEHAANSIQYLVGKGYKVALSKDAEGKMFPMIVDGGQWRPATWGDAFTVYAKQNPEIRKKVLTWKYSKEPIVGYHVVDFDLKGGSRGTEIKGYHFGSPVSEISPLSDEDKKLFFPTQSNLQESIRKILRETIQSCNTEDIMEIANHISDKLHCDVVGSCVHFAELFVEKLHEINPHYLNCINVVEGYVDTPIGDGIPQQHTWIETESGIIDPTFLQFTKYGKARYMGKKKTYTGMEYYQEGISGTWFSEKRKKHPEMIFKK